MARRKHWGDLTRGYRNRMYEQYGKPYGISRRSYREMWNRGTARSGAAPQIVQRKPGRFFRFSAIAIVTEGHEVDTERINELTRGQLSAIGTHKNYIDERLGADPNDIRFGGSLRKFNKYIRDLDRKIRSYEGKQTGGSNSREFASDIDAIIRWRLRNPDEIIWEAIDSE